MVVIVFGLLGCGKSYFASRVARIMRADYINSARVRKKILAKRTYSKHEKETVYNKMLTIMKEDQEQDRNVVLDGNIS